MDRKIFFRGADRANEYHRIFLPVKHTSPEVPDITCTVSFNTDSFDYDVFNLYGLIESATAETLGKIKIRGKKLVWHLDDDFMSVPSSNPFQSTVNQCIGMFYVTRELADMIVVSNRNLIQAVGVPHKTIYAPNLIDPSLYPAGLTTPSRPIPGYRNQFGVDKVRILWAGSASHKVDLEQIVEPMREILDKYSHCAELIFFGFADDELVKTHLNRGVVCEPMQPFGQYFSIMNRIRPHIVLAPLIADTFNRSKSNIRVTEGQMLQAAVVASPNEPYNCLSSGENGIYATTANDWYNAVETLILDEHYREQMGRAGREEALRRWNWLNEDCRSEWRQVFERMRDL
jgi:glycosyltransferase involved in cell wall biosynthesis